MGKKKEKIQDITKVGPQTYRTLQDQNSLNFPIEDISDFYNSIESQLRYNSQAYAYPSDTPVKSSALQQGRGDYLGQSKYDKDLMTQQEFDNYSDIRADSQPRIAKLAAGIGKGAVLTGTTFLDGTLGLIYGIADVLDNIDNKEESGYETFSRLWDNALTDGTKKINDELERILPNYRTQEEQDNPWYKNLGTVNFWADSFIKNLGFTVGAMYSGGAWTKALKGIGVLKSALGANITGSVLSAVNEARIEANNNSDDWEALQRRMIQDSYDRAISEAGNDSGKIVRAEYEKSKALEELNERKAKMGLTDFIGNTILLSLDNISTYGKIFSRGFNNAEKVASRNVKNAVTSEIIDGVTHYTAIPTSKMKTFARGLKHGAVEGNEELAQAFLSEFAGNWENYDSPDAYYNAMTNPYSEKNTIDFISSATKGFMDTYGNFDRYEEFAVGFLTGIVGIPTFGRNANSDATTWTPKGKMFGISGGLLGEFSVANKDNADLQAAVEYANEYMKKQKDLRNHFIQSDAFTNAMSGWADATDNDEAGFQFKNMEDNDDFAAISRFARMGRLNDFKELIDRDYDSIDDSELDLIAKTTTMADGISGWRMPDGSYMSDSESGKSLMRQELKKKQKKLKDEVELYEKAIETVRAAGYNDLDPSQEDELAWLQWKIGKFDQRYNSIKKSNESVFDSILEGIASFKKALEDSMKSFEEEANQYGDSIISDRLKEDIDENNRLFKLSSSLYNTISELKSGKSLVNITNSKAVETFNNLMNEDFLDLFVDKTILSSSEFKNAKRSLLDISRLATARNTFSKRLDEFYNDPSKLKKNRERLDKKNESKKQAIDTVQKKDDLRSMSQENIFELTDDELDQGIEMLENSEDSKPLVDEKEKRNTFNKVNNALDDLKDTINPEIIENAKTLLELSNQNVSTSDELMDLSSDIYNDPSNIGSEYETDILFAKNAIQSAYNNVLADSEELDGISSEDLDDFSKLTSVSSIESVGKDGPTPSNDVSSEAVEEKLNTLSQKNIYKVTDSSVNAVFNDLNSSPITTVSGSKKGFKNAIYTLLSDIYDLYNKDYSAEDIFNAVKTSSSYSVLNKAFSELPQYIRSYVNDLFNIKEQSFKPDPDGIDTYVTTLNDLLDEDSFREVGASVSSDLKVSAIINTDNLDNAYDYWKSQTTLYPIHPVKGDYTTKYSSIVDPTKPFYKRVKTLSKFLEDEGAYALRDNNGIHIKDKIHYKTIKSLNDKAGETVILLVDEHGRILGDIASKTDSGVIANQTGILKFIDDFEKAYAESNQDDFEMSGVESYVSKILYGKTPFAYNSDGSPKLSTINEIFGDNPFKIGVTIRNKYVQLDPMSKKSKGPTLEERSIRPLKNPKIGQPLLVFNAGIDNRLISVPFIIPAFNPETMSDTMFMKALVSVLEDLKKANSVKKTADISDELNKMFIFPKNKNGNSSFFIDNSVSKSGKVLRSFGSDSSNVQSGSGTIVFKMDDPEFHVHTIFEGDVNSPDFIQNAVNAFTGLNISVNRHYIQSKFRGQDYSRMIGEIAQVNLVPEINHCVGNFFTVSIPGQYANVMNARNSKKISEAVRNVSNEHTFDVKDNILISEALSDPLYSTLNSEIWDNLDDNSKKTLLTFKTSNRINKAFYSLRSIWSGKKFITDPMSVIKPSPKNLEASIKRIPIDMSKELEWLDKTLPSLGKNDSVKIVNGLIKISGKTSSSYAYGQFKDGIMYISNNATSGTVYHEAFHAVVETLLDSNEYSSLMDAAEKKYGSIGTLELEEKLAEDFRNYVRLETIPYVGNAIKIFRQLKTIIQRLFNKTAVIDSLFYRINSGSMSNNDSYDSYSSYENIKKYHENKMSYENLSDEQLNYLKEISMLKSEYTNLSLQEKDILFRCM